MKLIIFNRIWPNGVSDLNKHHHIPVPGRVQYYRAEQLPFIPAEVKNQLKFPKAIAQSEINLRYLDRIRELTREYINNNVG